MEIELRRDCFGDLGGITYGKMKNYREVICPSNAYLMTQRPLKGTHGIPAKEYSGGCMGICLRFSGDPQLKIPVWTIASFYNIHILTTHLKRFLGLPIPEDI